MKLNYLFYFETNEVFPTATSPANITKKGKRLLNV